MGNNSTLTPFYSVFDFEIKMEQIDYQYIKKNIAVHYKVVPSLQKKVRVLTDPM